MTVTQLLPGVRLSKGNEHEEAVGNRGRCRLRRRSRRCGGPPGPRHRQRPRHHVAQRQRRHVVLRQLGHRRQHEPAALAGRGLAQQALHRPAGEDRRPVAGRADQRRGPGHPGPVLAADPAVHGELHAGEGRRAALAHPGRHLRALGQRRRRQLSSRLPAAAGHRFPRWPAASCTDRARP
ncbi:hypothetical protein SGPA1_30315 [Streptomyces misionensis JCM 4497]